ncbi:MAG: Holliday junction branch migration protein RuvA [Pseudobdellovibrionaceae bacterium]
MIAFLRGKILEVDAEAAVDETQGVGYEVLCALGTLAELQPEIGTEVEMWIHTHVREDALLLFGFLSKQEKNLFLSLLKVNGVGPKSALSILGAATIENLQILIEAGDVKGLTALPKIGKKTAEQIILTLKGKLVFGEDKKSKAKATISHSEIRSALVNLGFRPPDVEKVIADFPADLELEEGVRRGLKALSSL